MKCPRCWTEKAYLRDEPGWKLLLMAVVFFIPMRCNHCYHRFITLWLFSFGKRIVQPEAPEQSQTVDSAAQPANASTPASPNQGNAPHPHAHAPQGTPRKRRCGSPPESQEIHDSQPPRSTSYNRKTTT